MSSLMPIFNEIKKIKRVDKSEKLSPNDDKILQNILKEPIE